MCGGSGRLPEERCHVCNGSGHERVKRTITVNIPAGIESGMRLRMEGYGEAGDPGASNGDLFIEIHVIPDKKFTRVGDNLEMTIEVSPAQAAIGTRVIIKTIDDREVELKVPPGVQYNTALKIPGEGVRRRGRPGDLLVRTKIIIPKHLSGEEKDLYKKILDIEGHSKKEGSKGFFQDLKDKMK